MKKSRIHIKKVVLAVLMTMSWYVMNAQNVAYDKTLAAIEAMPRAQAIAEINKWLDATALVGAKEYKKLTSSLEEMLSEPTWDYHNEELFAHVMEHAATASCLSENERLRPTALLEVVHKNIPGSVAHDIEYETIDGSHGKLSEINTHYTLIYFNDPECLSCAKAKERLDTCTILKDMVSDSILTVIGIYPYDDVEEWKLEPFPSYIINGWDFKQEVDGEQSYDLMTMPLFYLLDTDKRVIIKNEASLNRVIKAMNVLKELKDRNIEAKLDAIWIK